MVGHPTTRRSLLGNRCILRTYGRYDFGIETMDIPVPADMAAKIDAIALSRHVSRDHALVDLLGDAITSYEKRRAALA